VLAHYTAHGWQARTKAGLPQLRVHDLKHIFGQRLRAAGAKIGKTFWVTSLAGSQRIIQPQNYQG
jgi:hypothetical protein